MPDFALAGSEPSAGVRVIYLEGELDPSGVIALQRRSTALVVDIGAVSGASASTLRMLCGALRRVNRRRSESLAAPTARSSARPICPPPPRRTPARPVLFRRPQPSVNPPTHTKEP